MRKTAKKAISGNPDAYGTLIGELKDYLYRTAWLYLRNEQAALDTVSETILKGYMNIRTLKEPDYFKTWLTKILIGNAADYCRKYGRQLPTEELPEIIHEDDDSSEKTIDLMNAINSLPENYRTAIILKYFDDMKISEIAFAMDVPENTVKSYLSRARAQLYHLLKEDYLYEYQA